MRRLLIATMILVLTAGMVWSGGQQSRAEQEVYTVRIAHTHTDEGLYFLGSVRFKELVEARSNGRIIVEHFPYGQLGGDRDIQEGISLGTIEAGLSSTPVVVLNEYFGLLDAPYLFVSREHIGAALDGELGQRLARPLEAHGIKHLGYWENGFRQITNNVRPINVPADLSGVLLRTPESPVRMATFQRYGASPVPMPFPELFGALEQGVVDGQENPLATIYQGSLHEVQRYLTLTNHIYSPVHLLFNKALFDSMPADLQQLLVDAGREVALYTRDLGAQNDAALVAQFEAAGVQVNEADISAFVTASEPVWDMIVQDIRSADAGEIIRQIADLAR
jgi:tripartite ATP-independent transporter DctP family solute receptor